MSIWILDTDHVTEFLAGDDKVIARIGRLDPSEIATTIITVQEIFNRWIPVTRNRRDFVQIPDLSIENWLD